jgi:transcriptional regulator with XRE-family HTH domain
MNKNITNFGKQCRKLRIDKDLTMRDVAAMTGYRQNYITQVENGKFNPSKEFLTKCIDIYGLTGTDKIEFIANALAASGRLEIKLDEIILIPKEDFTKLLALLAFALPPPYPNKKEWEAVAHCMEVLLQEINARIRSSCIVEPIP